LRIAYAPEGQPLRHPCLCLKADRRRAPWVSSQPGHRPATVSGVARLALTPLWLSSLLEKASQGTAAGLLHQGQALHCALAGDAWDCGVSIPLTSGQVVLVDGMALITVRAATLRHAWGTLHAPAGWPPWAGHQRGPEGRPGGPRCWRTAVTDLCVPGDRRRIRVPDAVRARAGEPRGDNVSPHPSRVAALRSWTNGLLLAGLCAAGHRERARAPSPERPP
jgi:hypothetical protein